jgi:hypothetical protein
MISLRITVLKVLTLLSVLTLIASCGSTKAPERDIASKSCWEQIKPEYNSYFDSVEKCIENKDKK